MGLVMKLARPTTHIGIPVSHVSFFFNVLSHVSSCIYFLLVCCPTTLRTFVTTTKWPRASEGKRGAAHSEIPEREIERRETIEMLSLRNSRYQEIACYSDVAYIIFPFNIYHDASSGDSFDSKFSNSMMMDLQERMQAWRKAKGYLWMQTADLSMANCIIG